MTKRFTPEEARERRLLSMRRWRAAHVDERRAYNAERAAGEPSRPIGRPRTRTGDRREYIQKWRAENRARLREYAARPDVLARRRERYRLAKEGKSVESSRCTDAEFEDGMVMMREFIATGARGVARAILLVPRRTPVKSSVPRRLGH